MNFAEHLGIRQERVGAGEAVLVLRLEPHLRAADGAGATGVLVSLMDAAMVQAALSREKEPRGVTTVDLRVGLLRPGTAEHFTATARVTGGGRSLCFCEASVVDAEGNVCAEAMATLRYRPAPVSSRT